MKTLPKYKIVMYYNKKKYSLEGEDAKKWMDIMTKIVHVFQLENQLPGFNWKENDNSTN